MSDQEQSKSPVPFIIFLSVISSILACLKITAVWNISWLWVFSPLWIAFGLSFALGLVVLFCVTVYAACTGQNPQELLKRSGMVK